MFDWSLYRGNLAWLPGRTILLCRHGSMAYGTNIPGSDEDVRGVAVAPAASYLGIGAPFEQAEEHEPDLTVFEIRKFISLAAACNPNVVEVMFVDDADRLLVTPLGERLLAARELFITKKAGETFGGYARGQLKRLELHRRYLLNPPRSKPTRAEYELPDTTLIPADQLAACESAIRDQLAAWSPKFLDDLPRHTRLAVLEKMADHLATLDVAMHEDLWPGAARTIGLSDNMIAILGREKRYAAAKREWSSYQTWKTERNPERAALEARVGYDSKHGMHLLRLLRLGREILETGRLAVRRPDAEELKEIRVGLWSYDRLMAAAKAAECELQRARAASTLPDAPDMLAIDQLCVSIVQDAL
jgi:predicted nucleotidyltransferase